jgi:hypothetical protein
MGQDVKTGDVYIFLNRLCTGIKILHLEHGGLVIYHMKLETGCFKLPVFDENTQTYRSTWHDLMLMVQGIDSSGKTIRKRWSNPDK